MNAFDQQDTEDTTNIKKVIVNATDTKKDLVDTTDLQDLKLSKKTALRTPNSLCTL